MLDKFSGNFDYTAHVFDRTEAYDLSDDYTLPDYMPAIGRVLTCSAVTSQPTLYLGGNSVECAGGVRYSLLYESADDGALFCADLPGEYDVMLTPDRDLKISADNSDISGLCDAVVENVTARVTAPRRLTIKSKLRLRPALRTKYNFEPIIHGADLNSGSVFKLTESTSCTVCACATAIPHVCRDTISRSEAGLTPDDDIRVISAHGDVLITHLQGTESGADCKGEISVSILLFREADGERPRRIIRKLPFSINLSYDTTLPANAKQIGIRGYGICPSVTYTVDNDAICLEAAILLSAETIASCPITFLKDLYSKEAVCEASRTELTLNTPVSAFNAHATFSASHDLASLGLDSGMRICDVTAKIIPDTEKDLAPNGKLTLAGKMRITAIADNGGEFIPVEFDGDFRYISDLSDCISCDNAIISAVITIGDVKGRIDAENIVCDCEICTATLIESKNKISVLQEANLTADKSEMNTESSVTVCYPSTGESLWDIAKKYRTDISDIADKNSLPAFSSPDSPDSLSKVKFLII